MELLDGKKVAESTLAKLKIKCQEIKEKGMSSPTLACVVVGDNPASLVYVKQKEKACQNLGYQSKIVHLDQNARQEDIIKIITDLNQDQTVHGILLQLPLPPQFDERQILNTISPIKDVDCLTDVNLGKLLSGTHDIAPCTAQGVLELFKHYNLEITGKNVVIIGRSLLAGKSIAELFIQENATVTLCHSKTKQLKKYTLKADIVIVAVGKPKFIDTSYIKKGTIVIDVGINRVQEKLVGDVNFNSIKKKASYLTPVPGGVGKTTIAELMKNTYTLYLLQQEK